ncbi:MAG: hypothetical protein ACW964_11545 [Candidatus Hodarchaeales archaeon]|jgi:hypothetical protein
MENSSPKRITGQSKFYLVTVVLKGIAIFPMIFGHAIGWWDSNLASNYESGSFIINLIMVTGVMVFPCFLYISGFNQVNSVLRRGLEKPTRQKVRARTIKRSLIFFLFATVSMLIMALVQSPRNLEDVISYLLTWHLFHLFALSSLFILCILELSYWIKEKYKINPDLKTIITLFFSLSLVIVIFLFFSFHNYTLSSSRPFPVSLNLQSILENIFLDVSSCGIIPWISFALAGAVTASYLDLPNLSNKKLLKKAFITLGMNLVVLVVGFLFLTTERFVSAGIGYPSSNAHVFISLGILGVSTILLILVLDLSPTIQTKVAKKYLTPIISLSKITLTVYFVHPVFAILNPNIVHSEIVLLSIVAVYCIFFVILSMIWQKWNFKYSLEWFINRFS